MPLSLNDRITGLLKSRPVIIQLLRFAAIGSLNTALDFVILNLTSKALGINEGISLGVVSVIGFSIAIIQSYIWNRAWAFAESSGVSVFQNALRLFTVGGLGFLTFVAVFLGASYEAASAYYLLVLGAFVISEVILWFAFGLKFGQQQGAGVQFASFLIVSLVGLAINSTIVVLATKVITPGLEMYVNPDVIKNVAKVLATAFSLIWNFVGYKLLVFKR